jgi:hypothetical protein
MGSSDNGWELSEWADWPTQLTAASAFAVYMQEIPESVQATVDTINAELRAEPEEIQAAGERCF